MRLTEKQQTIISSACEQATKLLQVLEQVRGFAEKRVC